VSIKKSFRLSRGFTLVELLVVIAIIGVLATLLLLQLSVARQRARDAKRIADVNQIRTGIELYFDDNGSYPAETMAEMAVDPKMVPRYLVHLPVDPLSGENYGYIYSGTTITKPTKFQVWAVLEQGAQALKSDSDLNVVGWTGDLPSGAGGNDNGDDNDGEGCPTTISSCFYDQGQQ